MKYTDSQQKRIKKALRNGRFRVEVRNRWAASGSPILVCFYRGSKLIESFFDSDEQQVLQKAQAWLRQKGLAE